MSAVTQIDAAGLKALMDAGKPYCLLDVREPWEIALARIPGSVDIPLQEIPARCRELEAGAEIIVMCHGGVRSQRAAEFLVRQGFGTVRNLQGGIDAWAREVDPTVPRY